MNLIKNIIMLYLVAACEVDGWSDMPTSIITPNAPDEWAEVWWNEVEIAATKWNDAMTALGCQRPFDLGEGGHEVKLVMPADWNLQNLCGRTFDRVENFDWFTRYFYEERIEIRAECIYYDDGQTIGTSVLLHELGHAIGLGHAPDGETAIMHSIAWRSTDLHPWDVTEAANILGCVP